MTEAPIIPVDIVSDVMCPWCIIGFKQLEVALGATGFGARVRWHPFELNPDMAPEGENTTEHIMRKYGSTRAQSDQARAQMTELGQSLGFLFRFTPESRIVNSFEAHQLLDLGLAQGLQHPLKLALFQAHFTDARDVSDRATLLDIAAEVGLDRAVAEKALVEGTFVKSVRDKQKLMHDQRISGVPTMIFGGKYAATGAQGAENYAKILRQTVAEAA